MNPAGCPDVALLGHLLLGRLSGLEAAPLEQHLLGCARCAQLAEEHRGEDALLRAMRAQTGRPSAAADEEVRRMIDWLLRGSVFAGDEEDIPTLVERRASSLPVAAGPNPAGGQQPPQVPGYEVLRELGSGGMGVIYLARQVRLNRLVALKMIRAGTNASAALLRRFQLEAEAVARLQHPNIVQIHEVGQIEGMPYFCLEFCAGGSLASRLREGLLPHNQAAQVLVQVADAVHAAHVAGVIHRDLKPANILLVGQAFQPDSGSDVRLESLTYVPKVTDFGLAKRLDSAEAETQTGELLGTPSYMAPEQAAGQLALNGPRTDVYALGAILYELLTGRPPFKAATVLETLDLVRQAEPVPVRQLQPRCPRDLETISLKCLQKEPARRYGSARELAEDLQRFLVDEPIRARPVGRLGRAARWVKRKPALAALTVVCVLAVVALLGLGFWFSAKMGAAGVALQAEAGRRGDAERLAQTHEFFGLLRAVEKRGTQEQPGWTWANLDDLAKAVALAAGDQHLAELRSEAASALGSIDIRRRAVVAEGFDAASLAFHPDGRWLALGQDRASAWTVLSVLLIDPRTGEKIRTLTAPADAVATISKGGKDGIDTLVLSPDGRWLAAGTRHGWLHAWDLTQNSALPLASWLAHKTEVSALCFARSGTALFSATNKEKSVLRWPVSAWDKPASKPKAEGRFTAEGTIGPSDNAQPKPLAVSPTEGWLCCLSTDNKLHFLSEETLQPLSPPWPVPATGIQLLPDGNSLVFANHRQLGFLNLRTRQELRSLSPPDIGRKDPDRITDLALSPDGLLLASSSEPTKHVQLWEVASGRRLADLYAGSGRVKLTFSPDGRTLVVTAEKQTLLYEIGGLDEQTFIAGSVEPTLDFALHPDGRSLACRSFSLLGRGERDIALWPLAEGPAEQKPARGPRAATPGGAGERFTPLFPLGRGVGGEGRISLTDHYTRGGYDAERNLSFHPRRQALAYTAQGKSLVRDSAGWLEARSLEGGQDGYLCHGPDGRLWEAGGGEVGVWDETGAMAGGWSNALGGNVTGKSALYCVAAGRRWVAVGGRDGQVHLLDAADVRRLGGAVASDAPVQTAAWNGDETLLAAGSDKGELCLMRPAAGADGTDLARAQTLSAHGDQVTTLSWLGSRLLASGSADRTVKLWSCADGTVRELLTLRQPAAVRRLAFHADGVRLFVLLEGERALRVWRLDRLFSRLTEMGLGADLEALRSQPLPPPVPAAELPAPVTEAPRRPNGLKAELFAGLDFQRLVKVRHDVPIIWWGTDRPDPLLAADCFSIRWTGWLKAPRPGRYTLHLESDDGSRLWLDGKLVIDLWQKRFGYTPHQMDVELTGQPQALRVEYFEEFGMAGIDLHWAQEGGFARQAVPSWALFHDRAAAEKVTMPPIAFLPARRSTAAEVLQARRVWADHLGRKEEEEIDLGGGVKMKLMLIPPGKFLMGSTPAEQALAVKTLREQGRPADDDSFRDEVQHEVEITGPYYLGAFLVTQAQYEKVMGKNPSDFPKEKGGGPDAPVLRVSWEDAVKFCEKLSRLQTGGGRRFRLPTEAEWEYACREGGSSQTAFHYGNSLSSRQANFNGNFPFGDAPKDIARGKPTPVGTFKPNSLGLFDMHANVWQWCGDYFHPYDLNRTTDPFRANKGDYHVLRGGNWSSGAWECRAASRSGQFPSYSNATIGFRVVMVVGAPTP